MTTDTIIQLAQLSTIVIGVLSVAVTLRSHRRQMHAQMFIEFSSRLHQTLKLLPVETWTVRRDNSETVPPRSEELTKACLQLFHSISDIYHLHRGGYISGDLWRTWHVGMQRAMQRPVVHREWLAFEDALDHFPEFRCFMRTLINERS